TVFSPSSLAARNTRMAISLRLATRSLWIGIKATRAGGNAALGQPGQAWNRRGLFVAQVSRQVRHVVARIRRRGDDLVGRQLARLAQSPERRRARTRAAVAEHRPLTLLQHGTGLVDHVGGDAFAAERDVVIAKPGSFD